MLQDLGCFGSPDIKTPNIDQMADEGIKSTSFMVASPVCSASRAAMLTGCYPNRMGVESVFFPNRGAEGLAPKHVTIAEVLKTVGYPTNQGFDSYYGIPYSNDMYPAKNIQYATDCLYREGMSAEAVAAIFPSEKEGMSRRTKQPRKMKDQVPLMRDETCIEFPVDQSTITKRYADESINFITESVKANKPFFLYLANSMPHTPLFASPQFKGKSERGLYGDVIEEIDTTSGVF